MASRGPRRVSVRAEFDRDAAQCALVQPSAGASSVGEPTIPCQMFGPKHLTAACVRRAAHVLLMQRLLRVRSPCAAAALRAVRRRLRRRAPVRRLRGRAAARHRRLPGLRAPGSRMARLRRLPRAVRRRGRARSRRSSTRFPSTGCCSSSNTAAGSRWPIGRVPRSRSRRASLATLAARAALPAGCVVALPLAHARQRERGFNQAREIAPRACARGSALPLGGAARARRAARRRRRRLPWKARARNVRGAFAVHGDVRGARIAWSTT